MINGYKIIALCVAKVHEETGRKITESLNNIVKDRGYRLFVYSTYNELYWNSDEDEGEKDVFELIDFTRIDLLIYCDENIKSDKLFFKLKKRADDSGVPVMVYDGHREGCININFNYTGGFEQIVRHVVEYHGIKKIHYMSGIKGNSFSDEREAVVKHVMEENGLALKETDISYGSFWSYPTRDAMNRLLEKGDIPRAIICANDTMALEVSGALKGAGYDVPGDVIVTGFDGIQEIYYSNPQITSCICDFDVVAAKVMELYEDERPYEEKIGDYSVLPKVLLSQSCGCSSGLKTNTGERLVYLEHMLGTYQNDGRDMEIISAKIQNCRDKQEMARKLRNKYLDDSVVVIKKECLDSSIDPKATVTDDPYGDDFIVVADSNEDDRAEPVPLRREQIIPHLNAVMEMKMPLIFVPLHFLGVPLGYVCLFFKDFSQQSYNRIFQITSTLDNAIGGYRNMQYQKFLQAKVEDNYRLDSLTGLLNRTGFFREFDALIERLKNQGGTLSMVLADLDNLKTINDTYGHGEGDKAICAVADALKKACPRAICCRFGGDEMIAVREGILDRHVVSGRVDMYMNEANKKSECPIPFSASIGIYTVSEPEKMNFDDMLEVADSRMYEIKREKKKKAAK